MARCAKDFLTEAWAGVAPVSPGFAPRPSLSGHGREMVGVGPACVVTAQHGLGRLPPSEFAEHLERQVHQVAGKLPSQRVPAPSALRRESCEALRPLPPEAGLREAQACRGIHGRGQDRRVPARRVAPSRLLEDFDGFGGQGRAVLVARPLVLGAPPHRFAFEVDVRPPEVANRADPMPGLVREHEGDVASPIDLPRDLEKCLVFVVRENDPGWVLLDGLPEALERVPVEEQAALLVPRPRRPVQHRHQEREVPFDHPVAHGLSTGADRARPALPDEPVPVSLGKGLGPSVPAEELDGGGFEPSTPRPSPRGSSRERLIQSGFGTSTGSRIAQDR